MNRQHGQKLNPRTNSPCNKSHQAFSALSSPTDPAHREPH